MLQTMHTTAPQMPFGLFEGAILMSFQWYSHGFLVDFKIDLDTILEYFSKVGDPEKYVNIAINTLLTLGVSLMDFGTPLLGKIVQMELNDY